MKIVKNIKKLGWLLMTAIGFSTPAFAAGPPQPGAMQNPLVQALIVLMVLLAIAIAILSSTVNSAASVFRQKLKEEKEKENKSSSVTTTAVMIIVALFFSLQGISQAAPAAADAATAVTDNTINGLTPITFYTIMGVLAIEILVIITLIYQLKWLMGIEKQKVAEGSAKEASVKYSITEWWNKINKSISIDREKDIDLEHDYDGIRELDNTIPPWWRLAFVFTIVFAIGYLYRYHVAKSAPLQIEEYTIAIQKADAEKEAYLKLSANNVDENSVKVLDAAGVDAGKALFTSNCVACHGPEGQGLVGPNLTDNYWIHGGDIKDVFKTIKYGYPDKGMRSWKEDFSPVQMAQLASFVKSIKGTNPPGPKEAQGTLFEEDGNKSAAPDSTVTVK